MQKSNSSLHLTEWLVVASIFFILSSLLVVAKLQSWRVGVSAIEELAQISVTIGGSVAKPGGYLVAPGTPVLEVIAKARPKVFADLGAFASSERVSIDCEIFVDELSELVVFVEGACVEETLKVPCGSRVSDLKKRVQLDQTADISFFKKKRCLKNKEIIKIPSKV